MIIQTISGITNVEHISRTIELMKYLDVDGFRINLCKIPEQEISLFCDRILDKLLSENLFNMDILLDIPFPKNKSRITQSNVESYEIEKNNTYILSSDLTYSCESHNVIFLESGELTDNISVGATIFYADGEGAFRVDRIEEENITVTALNRFYIRAGKAIFCSFIVSNFSNWQSFFNLISKNGHQNIKVLPSFVENKQDILNLKKYIPTNLKIIAKIETISGINNINEILDVADGIVIARGDLALNVPLHDYLKSIQKIATFTLSTNKELYCATDILNHIHERLIPERAELIDLLVMIDQNINNFILPGTSSDEIFNTNIIESKEIIEMMNNRVRFINKILKESSDQ